MAKTRGLKVAKQYAKKYPDLLGGGSGYGQKGTVNVGYWDHMGKEPHRWREVYGDLVKRCHTVEDFRRHFPKASTGYVSHWIALRRYMPQDFVRDITQREADAVSSWLSGGTDSGYRYKGSHRCLMGTTRDFCGSGDSFRDGFFYPNGLSIYAEEFKVVPPGIWEHLQDLGVIRARGSSSSSPRPQRPRPKKDADFPINKQGLPQHHVWWRESHTRAEDFAMFESMFECVFELHRTKAWLRKKAKAAR